MRGKLLVIVALVSVLALTLSACATPIPETVQVEVTREVKVEVPVEVEVEVPVEVTAEVAIPEGPYEHIARAMAGEFAGTEVNIFGVYTSEDEARFRAALVPFEQATGIEVNFEGSGDFEQLIRVQVEAGDPPDIAQFSQPGLIAEMADKMVPLDSFMNMDQLKEDYIQSWLDLATFDGQLYGLFYRANTKSLVWYYKPTFDAAGYEVPETWDELLALMDEMAANGHTPWCVPAEHGGSTGWVITDWVEDALLRTAGPEVYDQWTNHEIPFTDPAIKEAMDEYVGEVFFNEDYVYGGPEGILTIWVGQTAELFPSEEEGRDEPVCWMMKQAGWIPGFFPESVAVDPDTGAWFFYFPPIKEELGKPVLGAGDPIGMFNDRPEVRAVMEYLATPAGCEVWVKTGGFISPNRAVPTDWYWNAAERLQGEIMQEADVFRFDASDLMPGTVGVGTFWSGMIEWVGGEKDTDTVLQEIDDSWPE